MKLKRGDLVKVIIGKDKGRTGKIEKIFPKENKVLVAGINIYKKHVRAQGEGKPGGIIEIAKPLPACNLVLICPKCKKSTRIGYRIEKDGEKHRVCKKCGEVI